MSYLEDTELRLEGFIIAHTILKHRHCWPCRLPFMQCAAQRERSRRLDQINARLWELNGD